MSRRTLPVPQGRRRALPAWGLSALLAGLPLPMIAQADAYLDALKDEASTVQVDPLTERPVVPRRKPAAPAAAQGQGMPAGLSQADFEAFLQKKYFGSFSFYRRLPRQKKDEVYRAYSERPDIRFIREQIKQTYLNQ